MGERHNPPLVCLHGFMGAGTDCDRLMFSPEPQKRERCRVLYLSPLKALGVDVERNLRAPLAGIAARGAARAADTGCPTVGVRSGDTPAAERARMARTRPTS